MARFGARPGSRRGPARGRRGGLPGVGWIGVLGAAALVTLAGCGEKRPVEGPWEARLKELEAENQALSERLAALQQDRPPLRVPDRCAEAPEAEVAGDTAEVVEETTEGDAPTQRPPLPVVTLAPPGHRATPSGRSHDAPPEPTDSGKARPMLRIHGSGPPQVLQVVDSPDEDDEAAARAEEVLADGPSPVEGGAVADEYAAALSLVQARRFSDAEVALRTFLKRHPNDRYSDNALYWLAECHYARGDYVGARREFQRLLQRHPEGNKVPDAWLKLGLAYDRLGDRAAAQRAFEELQKKYSRAPATHRIPARYLGTQP